MFDNIKVNMPLTATVKFLSPQKLLTAHQRFYTKKIRPVIFLIIPYYLTMQTILVVIKIIIIEVTLNSFIANMIITMIL